jgi:hypothetical protein
MTRLMTRIAGAVAVAAVLALGPALAGGGRVVVELFTSQGCSSCPPADALLGELAAREDLIALSFHVDYWNYLGWKDPFSSADATERQRDYREMLGQRYVYTPQMVVGGTHQAVGSSRDKVEDAIGSARELSRVAVEVARPDRDTAVVTIAGGAAPAKAAIVWLFAYDDRHSTDIRRGENEGVKLTNTHVVRAIRKIGKWDGGQTTIKLPISMMGIEKQDGCAVVVQSAETGRVFGAESFALKLGGS